ncbi:Os04g0511500, partial [Oryza sativa Japonica Group]
DDEREEGDGAEEEEGGRRAQRLGEAQERLRDDEVGHPVGHRRDAAADAPEPQRVDLRVDDPWHGAHARGVGDDVRAERHQRQPPEVVGAPFRVADRRRVVRGAEERAAEHGEPQDDADEADDHQATAAGPVHEEHADDGPDGVEARGDEGQRHGRVVRREAGQLDDRRAVVHDGVDADELLGDL